jgi:cyclic pyranopterin phosphate synthase
VDLRAVICRYTQDMPALQNAIVNAMALKPERHYFYHDDKPQVLRFMNATGG